MSLYQTKVKNDTIKNIVMLDFADSSRSGVFSIFEFTEKGSANQTQTVLLSNESEKFCKKLDSCKLNPYKDIYMIKNPTYKKGQRSMSDLFSLNHIVIDIDAHALPIVKANKESLPLPDKIYSAIAAGSLAVPYPNFIARTGRGVQVWYVIESLRPDFDSHMRKYSKMTDFLICHFSSWLKKSAPSFEVDCAASRNTAGLVRMPGSYNQKVARYEGAVSSLVETVTIPHVFDRKHSFSEFNIVVSEQKTKKKSLFAKSTKQLCRAMDLRLSRLLAVAERVRIQEGKRDFFCFCAYNTLLKLYDADTAFQKLTEINKKYLANPLSENELRTAMQTSSFLMNEDNTTGYKLKDKTICDYMGISLEFWNSLCVAVSLRQKMKEKRAAAKDSRNQLIASLHHQGYFQTDIAAKVGVHRNTVRSVLTQLGLLHKPEAARKHFDVFARMKDIIKNKQKRLLSFPCKYKPLTQTLHTAWESLVKHVPEMNKGPAPPWIALHT